MDIVAEGSGYVVLTEEADLMRAHWVAGAIEAAGIPVHVEENNLQDEFAVAQKLLGGMRIRVLVPADRRDEANTVFLNLSQPIVDDPEYHDEEDDEALEDMEAELGARNMTFGLVIMGLLFGVPFFGWLIFDGVLARLFGID